MAAQPVSVLITGANRGLGLEMVKQMLESPRRVRKLFACCRDPDGPRAEALQTLAKKHPNIISIIRLDANDLCSIKQSAQKVGSVVGTGGLNLLINNAGILASGTLQETSPEDMQNSFNTNVMGPMNMIKEFLPHLRSAVKASGMSGMSSSKAAVVNISSVLGSMEMIKQSYAAFPVISYRISKAGLNMLALCAAEELKKDEILFSLLHPGWVRTDMGGEEGEIDAPESVQGMLRVMASLTEKQNGAFLDYKGNTVPW
ncbi:C-factor-like [Plectropomus leopardus]|uniref:C-factor-like n=1 Tax=Plectropomus leopardus TaxID=160734 RepID=UPI001C4D5882|nr:C-factor-like [Plectropomus leopardus]